MKFMMIVKASKESEAGVMPSEALLSAMGKLQRGAHESRRATRSRRSPAKLQGHAHQNFPAANAPLSTALHRSKGTHRRLLDHPGQVPRRGPSSGPSALPLPTKARTAKVKSNSASFSSWTISLPAKLSIGTANSARNSKQKNNSRSCRFRRSSFDAFNSGSLERSKTNGFRGCTYKPLR